MIYAGVIIMYEDDTLNMGIPWIFGYFNSRDYYDSLSDEVKQAINEHADEIHSEEELHAYAEYMSKKK